MFVSLVFGDLPKCASNVVMRVVVSGISFVFSIMCAIFCQCCFSPHVFVSCVQLGLYLCGPLRVPVWVLCYCHYKRYQSFLTQMFLLECTFLACHEIVFSFLISLRPLLYRSCGVILRAGIWSIYQQILSCMCRYFFSVIGLVTSKCTSLLGSVWVLCECLSGLGVLGSYLWLCMVCIFVQLTRYLSGCAESSSQPIPTGFYALNIKQCLVFEVVSKVSIIKNASGLIIREIFLERVPVFGRGFKGKPIFI